jgi:hypothetical protein
VSVNDSKIKSYCLFPQSFSSVKIQIFLFCNDFRHVFACVSFSELENDTLNQAELNEIKINENN